jgi:hypothetical protein
MTKTAIHSCALIHCTTERRHALLRDIRDANEREPGSPTPVARWSTASATLERMLLPCVSFVAALTLCASVCAGAVWVGQFLHALAHCSAGSSINPSCR